MAISVKVGEEIKCYTKGHQSSNATGILVRICGDTEEDHQNGLGSDYGILDNGMAVNLHHCRPVHEVVVGVFSSQDFDIILNDGTRFPSDVREFLVEE